MFALLPQIYAVLGTYQPDKKINNPFFSKLKALRVAGDLPVDDADLFAHISGMPEDLGGLAIDIRKLIRVFLSRCQQEDYYNRPTTDEFLLFFTAINNLVKLHRETFDSVLPGSINVRAEDSVRYLAKCILLAYGVADVNHLFGCAGDSIGGPLSYAAIVALYSDRQNIFDDHLMLMQNYKWRVRLETTACIVGVVLLGVSAVMPVVTASVLALLGVALVLGSTFCAYRDWAKKRYLIAELTMACEAPTISKTDSQLLPRSSEKRDAVASALLAGGGQKFHSAFRDSSATFWVSGKRGIDRARDIINGMTFNLGLG